MPKVTRINPRITAVVIAGIAALASMFAPPGVAVQIDAFIRVLSGVTFQTGP